MSIVSDSGPILSFARARCLGLLGEVVEELIIHQAVYKEIVIRDASKPGAEEVQSGRWIKRQRVKNQSLVAQLPERLHLGEREAIALAVKHGATLLVDEVRARANADRLGIVYFGNLFVLQEAKHRQIIRAV